MRIVSLFHKRCKNLTQTFANPLSLILHNYLSDRNHPTRYGEPISSSATNDAKRFKGNFRTWRLFSKIGFETSRSWRRLHRDRQSPLGHFTSHDRPIVAEGLQNFKNARNHRGRSSSTTTFSGEIYILKVETKLRMKWFHNFIWILSRNSSSYRVPWMR